SLQPEPEPDDLSGPDDLGGDDGAVLRCPHRQRRGPHDRHQAREVPPRRRRRMNTLLTGVYALILAAQIGGKPVVGGNPTPGTPQPDPPSLADRVTLSGCVEAAKSAPAVDGNTVTDSKFRLTSAERVNRVPPDTGGSPLASSPASGVYRLAAIESQLSPF